MPKDSSKLEARNCAANKIMNPDVNNVEIDITADKIEVHVGYYDGATESFKWYDA